MKNTLLKKLGILLLVVICFFSFATPIHLSSAKEESLETLSPSPSSTPNTINPPSTNEEDVSKEEVVETLPPTPAPEPEFFELTFMGDFTIASSEYNKTLSNSYENTINGDFTYPFAYIRDYFVDDDFSFINLECALTTSTTAAPKTFCFKADPSYVDILTDGNIEFVSLGNNHVLDYGEEGYKETKSTLDGVGIGYAGRDEWSIYETDSGLKIGVYAVSFGTADQIKAGIQNVRNAGAEFVIAALHWGDEGSYKVNADQKTCAYAAVDAGADFVYGSHPHTLQPYEEYKGVYIYYSMGNGSFGGNTNLRDPNTVILKLHVKRDIDGTLSVDSREHIPCAATGVSGNNYQPVPYEVDSDMYNLTMSKLEGTFDGTNLSIGYDYTMYE